MTEEPPHRDENSPPNRSGPKATDVLRAGAAAYDFVKSRVRGYDPELRNRFDDLEGMSVDEYANRAVDGITEGRGLPSGRPPTIDWAYSDDGDTLMVTVDYMPAGLEYQDFNVDVVGGTIILTADAIGWESEVQVPGEYAVTGSTVQPTGRHEFEVRVRLEERDGDDEDDEEPIELPTPEEWIDEEPADTPVAAPEDSPEAEPPDEEEIDEHPRCVYCDASLDDPAVHHLEEHPTEKYDPIWYSDVEPAPPEDIEPEDLVEDTDDGEEEDEGDDEA